MTKDYYEILGIKKGATDDEIKRAYRRLAHEYHPDRVSGDEKKFKEINEAYQVSSDKQKRAQYDQFGPGFKDFNTAGAGFSGFDFSGFKNAGINFEDLGDIGDIFDQFFTGSKRRTYTQGNDLQTIQEISLEEAYSGLTKEIQFESFQACGDCSGLGHDKASGSKTCDKCSGKGDIKEVKKSFFGTFSQVRACDKCSGSGKIPNKICTTCRGEGRIRAIKKVKIDIAPGVDSGQLIKIAGAGEVGIRGAKSGDLYIQIRIQPHKVFTRQGSDLFMSQKINMVDILLGKEISVATISGKEENIKLAPGTSINEKVKVVGAGMPRLHKNGYGDMYVNLEVATPKKLSAKAKKLLEELDKEF